MGGDGGRIDGDDGLPINGIPEEGC